MNALSSWFWKNGTTRAFSIGQSFTTMRLRPFQGIFQSPALDPTPSPPTSINTTINRSVITHSMLTGKRKTVKTVLTRFYRLDWGAWIRPKAGRHRKVYLKNTSMKRHAREHIFVNSTQSRMFDKMVTKFWRTPKYYVDDPYESYHKRDNFYITKGLVK